MTVDLEMQPVSTTLQPHTLPNFLGVSDFEYVNPSTGRTNTYAYSPVKVQAIAAARKSLSLGTVAVFAATKSGNQGVVALAQELLRQLELGLPMPGPYEYVFDSETVGDLGDYLEGEYGANWIGTRALRAGAVVHHGDVPQETREALEELLTTERLRMVLCTSTLAEGVNLPIRTLILYAVRRHQASGPPTPMLARDIRNLVGRAGRAGSSTKGLVVCANPNQWSDVLPVAAGQPGEDVHGALLQLLSTLINALRQNGLDLTNAILEANAPLYPLVDGVDAALLELLHDELGDQEFRRIASSLASRTFAWQQADDSGQRTLSTVFALRASRIAELRATGRVSWVRETGAKTRLLDSVVDELAPRLDDWGNIDSPVDEELLNAVLGWAYGQPDFQRDLSAAYRGAEPGVDELRRLVQRWISGESFSGIAQQLRYDIDVLLRIHGSVIAHALVTLVEQGVALLERYLSENELALADAALNLPEYVRFGVATPAARVMMAGGMRHRRAAVVLGNAPEMTLPENALEDPVDVARDILEDERRWRGSLGDFVYGRTLRDVGARSSW